MKFGNSSRSGLLLSGACLVAFGMPTLAFAQDAGDGLEEITVTAQRRAENLQDVPISVSAVTAETLDASGVANTEQLEQVVPGLALTNTAGNTQVRIRGVGTSSFGPGIENPVAVYVDGVYIASTAGAFFNLANVERVEVLRGPQGTLFGRNATGGLVQVITPDPDRDAHGMGRVSYGNYQTASTDLYATGPLGDVAAVDFSLHYSNQGEGYGVNVNTGNDVNRQDHDLLVRSSLLIEPSDTFRLRVTGDYTYSEGSAPLTLQQRPGIGNVGVFELLFTNRLDPNPLNDLPLINHGGFQDNSATTDPRGINRGFGLSADAVWSFDGFDVRSITAFRESSFDELFDIERVPQDVITFDGTARWQQFSQEVQLSSTGDGPFKWTAGLYYFQSTDAWDPHYVYFGPDGAGFILGDPAIIDAYQRIESEAETNSIAAYAQGTYDITDRTSLTLGVRYTDEERSANGTIELIANYGFPVPFIPPGSPVPGVGIPDTLNFDNFSYRVALDHQFTDDILGYVSYNTGFKSGGFNIQEPSNPPFDPEEITAWEAGLKMEFLDRRLRLNLAAFTYEYQDIQVSNFVSTAAFVTNGAAAQIDGAEVELSWLVTSNFTLNASAAYSDNRFTDYPDADYNYLVPDCDFSNPSPSRVCQASANGNRLQGAPTETANLGFIYERDVSSGTFGLTGNIFYSSGFFGTTDNDPRIQQEAYSVVNASAYWDFGQDGENRLTLWGRNLTDEEYVRNTYISSGQVTYQAEAPLTYGVSFERNF